MLTRTIGISLIVCGVICIALMAWNVRSTKDLQITVEKVIMEKEQKLDGQLIRVRRSLGNDEFVEYEAARREGESFDAWNARLVESRKLASQEVLKITEEK